ncbi:filamentous hemagglutinin N-terminal domain-containing protein [Paraburkholderia strydomiana]|uniref:two-partner secretion domain-containing protein n=1 Tax=Paraburkholderia strydomiana TaxID=1245417 RepID=UPI001BE6F7A2|nr:filamentous hemagglutinin N-terminal domain-containing protein [Paraburkholderia strydomiana]MBT2793502.1 filamentous hemagglutinin N-terminal domain-containing protein [Paraburkholderia strydomiana]
MSRPELSPPARCARHRGQSNGRLWLAVGISLTGLSFAHATFAAGALPQGGTYVGGAGTIASQGNGLVITQPGSTRGVIDWNSFSIGRNNSVAFDNGAGATLNRITGGSPSAILGRLSATGSLYVINRQGIVVGPSGVIKTGGRFVASTLDVCSDAFMQGSGSLALSGNSNAAVINLGRISSSGGDVFLVARDAVINAGTVAAPNGTAELAAGGQVLLQDSASSRQIFVQTGSHGTVINKGRITAAQVSLQAADGNVYALAGGGTRIRATGTASRDGHVWLVADSGGVEQLGKIAASNADGSGGTVDTQAGQLTFGRHTVVDAGQWNLSTPTFTIDDGAAHALQRSLNAGTSVDVTTTGVNGATGDLGVASSLRWSGPASLTLAAYHDVSVTTGTTIANSGAGNLTLRADASAIDNGGGVINNGTIDWSKSTGNVSALYDMNGSYSPGTLVANPVWSAPLYSGLVTQITGYQLVNSVTDLQNIQNNLAGNYALGKDIDGSNFAFVTLAAPTFVGLPAMFTGQFDGMWHTISNVLPSDVAIFGDIGATGVVRNVNVNSNVSLTAPPETLPLGAGILAFYNYGTIANVFTSGAFGAPVSNSYTEIAGLVAENDGLIARSGSSATLQGGSAAGLALTNGGTITESYTIGSVTGSERSYVSAGGLVLGNESATYVGHGETINQGTITQSFVAGPVSSGATGGSATTGGICAPACGGIIGSDVYWNVQTTGQSSSGGNLPASNGLTTAQMSERASFVGWDFGPNGAWTMPPGATHPVLTWQVTGH